MSEKNPIDTTAADVTAEQAKAVGGGDCTINDISSVSGQLVDTYENLIDAASYLIERVNKAL